MHGSRHLRVFFIKKLKAVIFLVNEMAREMAS